MPEHTTSTEAHRNSREKDQNTCGEALPWEKLPWETDTAPLWQWGAQRQVNMDFPVRYTKLGRSAGQPLGSEPHEVSSAQEPRQKHHIGPRKTDLGVNIAKPERTLGSDQGEPFIWVETMVEKLRHCGWWGKSKQGTVTEGASYPTTTARPILLINYIPMYLWLLTKPGFRAQKFFWGGDVSPCKV